MRGRWRAYRREALRDDLVAAFIVAVLLIPQSLAYALLAGLPPQAGLYASLLPMAAYAALGSSSVNSVGPVAVVALLTAHAIEPVVASGTPATAAALVLAAEAGLLLGAAALFRLDALAALLSTPVLHGFSTGAALAITLSQLPALLGSPAKGFTAPALAGSWWASGVPGHALTAAFGLLALALLWWARRFARPLLSRWLPAHHASLLARCAPLAVVGLSIALAWALAADTRGVALVGTLPAFALPLALPPLDAALWWRLLPSAVPLALVTFVSSLAVSEGLGLRRREQVAQLAHRPAPAALQPVHALEPVQREQRRVREAQRQVQRILVRHHRAAAQVAGAARPGRHLHDRLDRLRPPASSITHHRPAQVHRHGRHRLGRVHVALKAIVGLLLELQRRIRRRVQPQGQPPHLAQQPHRRPVPGRAQPRPPRRRQIPVRPGRG